MTPTTGLRLVAHAHTAALRRAVFGAGDDDLDEGGRRAALALAGQGRGGPLGTGERCLTSPALAAVQTAYALGLHPTVEAALADCGYGGWSGRSLADVGAREPDALRRWWETPEAAPHGGESLVALRERVGAWLDGGLGGGGRVVAVTHPMVVRVAVGHVLQLPTAALFRLDVAPLAVVRLSRYGSRWQLQFTAPPVGSAAGAPAIG
ncbi:histidine phosphatase family protein [Micromonospora rifamycinica]|uniref:Broad specificity phosphatase PhoE n=1 Tax=Micromonospora rifamycinica TaxID=291594 RepID=A0A1C5GWQ4_9ACTN|nr:histidine phosphatase family protein [Micromonospora rifamycinica]SCG38222.1 Broad specificity phosphatase PhoE [Micromonospora rifamycinica]